MAMVSATQPRSRAILTAEKPQITEARPSDGRYAGSADRSMP